MAKKIKFQTLDEVTIRFAGDSGDGMQLSGGSYSGSRRGRYSAVATPSLRDYAEKGKIEKNMGWIGSHDVDK